MSDQTLSERGAFGQQPQQHQQASGPTTPIPAVPKPSAQMPQPPASGTAGPGSPAQPTGLANAQGVPDSVGAVLTESAGFLRALFDFSFTHFVTPKLVRFVYLLATIGLAIIWLGLLVAGFSQSVGQGLLVLVLGPVVLVVYLALIRMTLEFYIAIVRMSEDIHKRLPSV